jgi:hypothetical protein
MNKFPPIHLQKRPRHAWDRDHPDFRHQTQKRRAPSHGLQAPPLVVAPDEPAELAQMQAAAAQDNAAMFHRAALGLMLYLGAHPKED